MLSLPFQKGGGNSFPFSLVFMSLLQKFIPGEHSSDAVKFLIYRRMKISVFGASPRSIRKLEDLPQEECATEIGTKMKILTFSSSVHL